MIGLKIKALILAAALSVCCAVNAGALEYEVAAPDDYLFGRPTSETTVYEEENPNIDRSKNTALIPPAFGSPSSYLPGTGEPFTPNLIPGALTGGLRPSTGHADYPEIHVDGNAWGNQNSCFTPVTGGLYYSDGSIGTLRIPTLGLNVSIREGTGSDSLRNGVGHFGHTSIWDGNVCLAGHNRGVNSYFGKIHTLRMGDTIELVTKLGVRTYLVTHVEKVSETDISGTSATLDNRITLYTCVRNEADYRWCVQAVERGCSL